jgi:hypothetical protein
VKLVLPSEEIKTSVADTDRRSGVD